MSATKHRYRIEVTERSGVPAAVLHDEAAELRATWAIGAGMLGASLVHRGEELLWQGAGVETYLRKRTFMGVPFLHPWANRLDGFGYHAGGRDVTLDPASPLLKLDDHGLPIHGLLNASPDWSLEELSADADRARMVAAFAFDSPALLAAFPFPHRVEIALEARDGVLAVTTTVTATGAEAVPMAFGFHPYLQIPGIPRAEWEVLFPVRRRLLLDARQIPTGATEDVEAITGPIGERTWDDAFDQIDATRHFEVRARRRSIAIDYADGYPDAQVFAPPGREYICLEPMTAPPNALRGPDSALTWAAPGTSFSATFRIIPGLA